MSFLHVFVGLIIEFCKCCLLNDEKEHKKSLDSSEKEIELTMIDTNNSLSVISKMDGTKGNEEDDAEKNILD